MSQGRRMAEEPKSYKKKKKQSSTSNKLDIFFKLIAFAFVVITIIFYISVLKWTCYQVYM